MKTFQLHKQTKAGISTWYFIVNDATQQYIAVGGDNNRMKVAKSAAELKAMYRLFKSYGYSKQMPSLKKEVLVADPWASELPLQEQMALQALA